MTGWEPRDQWEHGVRRLAGRDRHGPRNRLVPSILPRTEIRDAIRQLSASPEPDLGRLAGIVRAAVNSGLQTQGLIGVAEVALIQAFGTDGEPPKNRTREPEGSDPSDRDSPSADEQDSPR